MHQARNILWQLPPCASITQQLDSILTGVRDENDVEKRIGVTPRISLHFSSGDKITGIPISRKYV